MARYGYLEEFEKMPFFFSDGNGNFQGSFGHYIYTDKIVYLKGESYGSLDSNELDIGPIYTRDGSSVQTDHPSRRIIYLV